MYPHKPDDDDTTAAAAAAMLDIFILGPTTPAGAQKQLFIEITPVCCTAFASPRPRIVPSNLASRPMPSATASSGMFSRVMIPATATTTFAGLALHPTNGNSAVTVRFSAVYSAYTTYIWQLHAVLVAREFCLCARIVG